MKDDTASALQALMQQVTKLTDTVTDQAKRLDDLHSFNTRILDEKKDIQRKLDAPKKSIVDIVSDETHDRKMRAANFEKDAKGEWHLKGRRPKHSISREDARHPAKYRDAKAAAEADGATLAVLDQNDGDPTIRNTIKNDVVQSKTFTFDDSHERIRYIRADMETGKGLIQRRIVAEKEGYRIQTFRTPDDLPAHARTKFDLMERAANAEAS